MAKRLLVLFMIGIFVFLGVPMDANAQTYKTKEEVYRTVKANLLAHKESFSIQMTTSTMKEIGLNTDLYDAVVSMDDKSTSKDADYLRLTVNSWGESWKWSSLGGTATLTFTAKYETTLEQEKQLDAKIKSVLTKLKIGKASDYKKVKAIHDYIIKKVSYDQTYSKHSAYNALIDLSAVCEGYTAVAYRMFTDAGIECKVITGVADGGAHSWNIVKVNGKWYNIDLTWDDPITNTGEQVLRYDYFLKNTKEFGDHTRDLEYSTGVFLKAYPISETSYSLKK
jgi:Uncharacterized protein involved in cytokinesis, contains TGc (transglutaminase/protease-like) domain